MKSQREMEKIAVFRSLQLGDMLTSVPTFRVLRQTFPRAQISLIGLPWAKEFQKQFSYYIDRFISFPGYPGLLEKQGTVAQITTFIKRMQQEQFDVVIQMHGKGTITNNLLASFHAKQLAGFYIGKKSPGELFIPYRDDLHEIDRLLELRKVFKNTNYDDSMEYPLYEKDYIQFYKLQNQFHIPFDYVIIHPGSQLENRRWNTKHFAKVADALAGKGFGIVITGTSKEKSLAQEVQSYMSTKAIDLTGETSLGTLGVLVHFSNLIVANDTGVSHVAAALGKKSVIIFSSFSDPKRWAPKDSEKHIIVSPLQAKNPNFVISKALQQLHPTYQEMYL